MRIEFDDVNATRQITHVRLALTESEARELRDTLEILLSDPGDRHEHVSNQDYQTELTLWIDRGEQG